MRIAYFDCFSGISGDMILGALVDAGLDAADLQRDLDSLGLSGYEFAATKVKRGGITGTHVEVRVFHNHQHRNLDDIRRILRDSSLPGEVVEKSEEVFRRLAEAESRIHGIAIEDVHFHEVGAVDAIVDIVGSIIGLDRFGVEKVFSSPLHVGTGFVKCAHGTFPVPAPATAELLKGIPAYSTEMQGELVTPTGAAIITTIAAGFGPMPRMKVERIGYGAGINNYEIPNMLRVYIGDTEMEDGYEEDMCTVIETNIDNMNPELYDHVMASLFDQGALDVFLIPVQMKKNRPGCLLSVVTRPDATDAVIDVLFRESTTLGVRIREARRKKLERETRSVATEFGPAQVKLGKKGHVVVNVSPEYEDCKDIARRNNVPLKKVYERVKMAAASLVDGPAGNAYTKDVGLPGRSSGTVD